MNITHYFIEGGDVFKLCLIWFCPNKLDFEKREVDLNISLTYMTEEDIARTFDPLIEQAKETISHKYITKGRPDL